MMTEIVSYQLAFNLAKLSLQKVLQERPKTFLSRMPLERALEYKLKIQEQLFFVEQTIQYSPEFESLLFVAKFGKDSEDNPEDSESVESLFDVYIELDVRLKEADIFLINTENGAKTNVNHKPEDLDILIDVIIQKEIDEMSVSPKEETALDTSEETELEYIETPETKYFLYQLLMDKFLAEKDYVSAKKLYDEHHYNASNSSNKPLERNQ